MSGWRAGGRAEGRRSEVERATGSHREPPGGAAGRQLRGERSTAHGVATSPLPPPSRQADDAKDNKTITYKQLLKEVCRTANALKASGVKRGDNITIYLPMIPEMAYVAPPR